MEIDSIKIGKNHSKNILRMIFIFAFLFCITSFPQNKEPRFEHISVKDGLPENTVMAILQDYLGYMWFYTQLGLVRYDGYEMTYYMNRKSGLSLYEDRNKILWAGSWSDGLHRFDRATDTFKPFRHNPDVHSSIGSNMIFSMLDDSKGRFWVGTDNGLDMLDRKLNKFRHYYFSDRSYSEKIYDFLFANNKSNTKIESILEVGNDADIKKTFTIKEEKPVLVAMVGEAGYDYGWLEDSDGNILFDYEYEKTFHAGGAFNNRIQLALLNLKKGSYKLHYSSNYFYSYEDKYQPNISGDYKIRTGEPPDFPELWGIQVFDASGNEEIIKKLLNDFQNIQVASKIFTIVEENTSGKIFIGTNSPGLWEFNENNQTISKAKIPFKTKLKREIGSIEAFYKNKDGIIWIGTTVGVCIYDAINNDLKFYQPTPSLKDIIPNHINSIAEDNEGNIWAGAVHNGLLNLNVKDGKFHRYRNNANDPYSIANNKVISLCFDNSGVLWTGYWTSGVDKWDKLKWKFRQNMDVQLTNILNNRNINTIYEDNENTTWLGTYTGLIKYNPHKKILKSFSHNSINSNSLSSDSILCIIGDPFDSHTLWIGTSNGLNRFHTKFENFIRYQIKSGDSTSLDNNFIYHLLVDHTGTLWVGTNGGINKFDKNTKKFKRYNNYNQAEGVLGSSSIRFFYEDNKRNFWIGYNGMGLLQLDRDKESFKSYGSDINSNYLISILTMCENEIDNLWVGTYMDGIFRFEKKSESISEHFTTENGLIDDRVLSMISDDNGDLWLTNHSGLTQFNPRTSSFKHYDKSEGLVENEFSNWYPLFKKSNGDIYFCGKGGFNIFNPSDILNDPTPPRVLIKEVNLFNRPNEKINYGGFISELKELTLSYSQNDLSFKYVGLHFGEPKKNNYKYILEGFDNDWIDAGNSRTATYTNLDPGEYVFRVRASNRDGVWNATGASLKVIINPPLWATTWAYLFYLILFGSLLYFIWKMQLKRVKVKHDFEMSRFETQKLHEVDEMKSRFFANISHEFRTPLTLILGPVKQIIERTKETKTKEDLNLVHRNANRLLGLVNQMLDISKIESGNMKLQTSPINIIPYLKALVLSFTSYAERKRISLKFISDLDELIVYIDKDKFEKIINNVLSNAFKFTPDGGNIEVTLTHSFSSLADLSHSELVSESKNGIKKLKQVQLDNSGSAEISITDTGVGIPKEKIQKIFDRFYQVDGSHTREQEGTGIGLSLTKELVELHKGKIEVESEEGKGSTFTVSIPLGTDHLKPDEIGELEKDKIEQLQSESILADAPVNKINHTDIDLIIQTDKPLLLIVEDNYDVRNYIKTNLDNGYRIIEAVDGEDGWNKSVNNLPDLIVSDVMMPKMDGFELCKKIKTDERTSHIPVILLTAKAAKQDKIEGYELGADEYLMKPFEPDELRVRIKNLINQRIKLHEHFKNKGILEVDETKITSVDKKFLHKAFEVINQNISGITFGVEALAELLNVSRSVLHRKIVSLTGESPGDLIRRIRLTKASHLIEQNFGNISEIAFEVGFSNPAQFSKSFQKQFGVTPSAYQQKITNN